MAIDNPSKATTSPILRAASPVRLNGQLDPALSRFMWLVKWLLAIPHVVLLGLLWVAVVAVSIVAFFAIVFTGRYPRSLFDFTVGVLRWTWRVGFYAYNAIGTDRYPPFTLGPAPEYAATIDVAYPEHLSRGLVLVKWLLAIPHYFVLAIFLGGGAWLWNTQDARWFWGAGGLISILVLVAGCALAVTGEYPRGLFDVLLGLNRWVYRVWAYVLLMTDAYPPWRFDPGPEPTSGSLAPGAPPDHSVEAQRLASSQPQPSRMSGGRIASVVIGSLVAMTAAGLLLAGATLLVTDRAARHDGALTSGTATLRTSSYAITSDQIDFGTLGRGWSGPDSLLGDARLSATSTNPTSPVFVGVGPADQVAAYLSGTGHAVVKEISDRTISYTDVAGGAPSAPPARASGVRWVAQSSGTGTQSIAWPVGSGRLTVVVMNADGSSGVDVRANVGATLPLLGTLATGLLAVGVLTLLIGAALVVVPLTRAPS